MKPLKDFGNRPILLWIVIAILLSIGISLLNRFFSFQPKNFYINIIIFFLFTIIITVLIYSLKNTKKKLNLLSEGKEKLLSNYTDPIIIINNGIIDYINEEVYYLLGLTHDKLLNTNILSIISLVDRDAFSRFLGCRYSKEIVVVVNSENKTLRVSLKKLSSLGPSSYMLSFIPYEDKRKEEDIKEAIISNISHEFSTPINVLYTALQLQEKYIENMSIADVKKYNKVMRKNCQRLIKLTNNIMDIAKIEQGSLKPNLVAINIVPIAEETSLSIVDFASKKNMKIVFDTEKEEIFVNCDVEFVQRIILNLLSNCIKYGRRGSIINIDIGLDSNDFMYIKIKNRGEWAGDSSFNHGFNCFHKGDVSFSRDMEGAGIGLYIAKALVELQGGRLFVTNSEKEYAVVYAVFPLIDKVLDGRVDNLRLLELEEKYIKEKAAIELSDIYT